MSKSITFFALLFILLPLSACQQSKDLGEMHDNTAEMNQSTKGMKQSLADMQTTMQSMLKNTQTLSENMQDLSRTTAKSLGETNTHMGALLVATNSLCQTRHSQSTLTRTDAFKKMIEARSPEEKVARATEYLMSFEFQMWGLCDDDTLASREALMTTAVQEFFFDLAEIKSSHANSAAMASLYASKDANVKTNADIAADMNFNAVAIALHGVDAVQQTLVARFNLNQKPALRAESVLSLIEDAMKADTSATRPSQHVILANRRLAVRVLQARQNFAVAVVIGKFANQESNGIGANISLFLNQHPFLRGALAGLALKSTPGGPAVWETSVDQFSADELTELSMNLALAIETREFLKSVKIPVQVDDALAPFVNGIRLKTSNQGTPDILSKRKFFTALLNRIRTQ